MSEVIKRLQDEFLAISGPAPPKNLAEVFSTLSLGNTAKNALLECQAGGRQVILNPQHPLFQKLARFSERSHLYYLLSAIVSVVNRADTAYHDADERRFHAQMLNRLQQLA